MIVRPERIEDHEASIEVERAAFAQADEAAVVAAVRGEPGSFAFVAEDDDGRVVGHVQCSVGHVGAEEILALGPIGVTPERQGQGIGRALVEAPIEEARARGAFAMILLGSPTFYGRFGFEPAANVGLANPYTGVQDDGFAIAEDDFQLLAFDERASSLHGDVRWHRAFGEPTAP